MAKQETVEVEEVAAKEESKTSQKKSAANNKKRPKEKETVTFTAPGESTKSGKKAEDRSVSYPVPDKIISVCIRRHDESLNSNTEIHPDIKKKAITKLSSVLVGRQPLKGVTANEQEILLPNIIEEAPGSDAYTTAVVNYFRDKSILVDANGHWLKVGKTDDGQVVPVKGHIEDYIDYMWAYNHPEVAHSYEEVKKNPNKYFFIYDQEKETKERSVKLQSKKKASLKFAEISEDEELMTQVLKQFPEEAGVSRLYKMSVEDKEEVLYDISDKKPEEFLEIASDKDIKYKSELEEMVQNSVIEKDGSTYYFMGDIIGRSKDQVVGFMKDDTNAESLASMRKKLDAAKQSKS